MQMSHDGGPIEEKSKTQAAPEAAPRTHQAARRVMRSSKPLGFAVLPMWLCPHQGCRWDPIPKGFGVGMHMAAAPCLQGCPWVLPALVPRTSWVGGGELEGAGMTLEHQTLLLHRNEANPTCTHDKPAPFLHPFPTQGDAKLPKQSKSK